MRRVKIKLRLLSDLHIEGYKYFYEWAGEDILILAGDIHTKNRLHELLITIPFNVRVLFVAGNHEYYDGVFDDVNEYLKGLEKDFTNFRFLNNESIEIDGINFFGGTMWTRFMLFGFNELWFVKKQARQRINDYFLIRKRDDLEGRIRGWEIEDHVSEHEKFYRETKLWLQHTEGKKRVMISHFAPHPVTIQPQYAGQMVNAYFTEDMSDLMGWDGLWLYGHTHGSFDGMVGDTRIISNPKGYGLENKNGFQNELIIEI